MQTEHFLSAGKDRKGRLTLNLAYAALIIAFEIPLLFYESLNLHVCKSSFGKNFKEDAVLSGGLLR